MSYKILIFKSLSITCSVFFISSCSFNQPVNIKDSIELTQKDLKITRVEKAKINIIINQYKPFEKKAYSGVILPKKINDVSLYKVFLSKNLSNPFGSSDMITEIKSIVPDLDTKQGSAVFNNIPDGGPYYAFVSAYEKVITNNDGIESEEFINITEPNNNLESIDKKWYSSLNHVNVSLGNTVFSDSSSALKTTLNLQAGIPSKVDNSIQIYAGDSAEPIVILPEAIN